MGRLKVLGIFAFLGFIGGIAADTVYNEVFPMILNIYPEILQAEWIFSGIAGSCGSR